jgi:hypothetical protein
MDDKKMGLLLLLCAGVFVGFLVHFNNVLSEDYSSANCVVNDECREIDDSLSALHFGFGFFGFMIGLGVFLVFFGPRDDLLGKLEAEKNARIDAEKFNIILSALDDFEKKVMRAVVSQEGITQNTLRIRTDMSKAKLSYVLAELEKRNLIKREQKGKSLAIFSRI